MSPPDLRWRLRSPNADEVRVYRATAPMDPAALPAPLVTLAATATRHLDTTAEAETEYFYRVASVLNGPPEKIALSAEASIVAGVGGGGGGGEPPASNQTIIEKAADETRNSTTTFADDAELVTGALDADSTYRLIFHIRCTALQTPDLKVTIGRTGLSDATLYFREAEDAGNQAAAQTWGAARVITGFNALRHVVLIADIRTGTDPGSVALQWAQNTSSAQDTTILANSLLIIEKAS